MRQVDHAADAKDQRQAERDQEIIASEHEAIHHLFQQEPELHSRFLETLMSAAPRCAAPGYTGQAFIPLVGLRTSIGSSAPGTAAPSVMRSHLSLAWPFGFGEKV